MSSQKKLRSSLFAVVLGVAAVSTLLAKQYGGATFQDIMSALGPDALGLEITADKLPDVASLQESRFLDESKKFIVEHPYTSGRWKGGKARVEYARDLSYAMVSIFDKEGRRERIYSVKARSGAGDDSAAIAQAVAAQEAQQAPATERPEATPVAEDKPEAVPAEAPAPEVVSVAKEAKPHRRRHHAGRSDLQIEVVKANSSSKGSTWVPMEDKTVDIDLPKKSRSHQSSHKKEEPSVPSREVNPVTAKADTVAPSSPVVGFEWDNSLGAYVPTKGSSHASEASASATPSAASSKKRKRGRHKEEEPPIVEVEPMKIAMGPNGGVNPAAVPVVHNESNVWLPPSAQKGVSATPEVPSTEELLADDKAGPKPPTGEAKSRTSHQKKESEKTSRTAATASSSERLPTAEPVSDVDKASQTSHRREPSRKTSWSSDASPAAEVPSTEALVTDIDKLPQKPSTPETAATASSGKEESRRTSRKSASAPLPEKGAASPTQSKEVPSAQPPAPEPVYVAPPAPALSAADKALIEKAKKNVEHAEAADRRADTVAEQNAAALAGVGAPTSTGKNMGPDTSEGDRWTPKNKVIQAPAEAELTSSQKVAMLPKSSRPENPSDAFPKVSGQNPSQAAQESDSWVPKAATLPKGETDLQTELARARSQKRSSPTIVKMNRDINNPEEGVLPVNSFEKFVGPRYGRHREYERRLMFGKKPKSTVQEYDFYVDEVDRRKEIHNVYYYKKGKVPKLVAVEKHYRVTFLSNYDVDKEDHGKVSIE